jgi:amphiphysin
MTAAQTRIADHISTFYAAADRTSDGAMASHAYKQSVSELDEVIQRELVSQYVSALGGH